MPTLCFGGSFNPIHNGHLICAQAVAQKAGYDRVLLIPSAVPPHKPNAAELASAQDRLAMCRLAAEETGGGLFEVSDIETRRNGPSYTIDTAQELRRVGFSRIDWLIGADMLLYLPKWHRAADLLREVHFVVMARPGWEIDWDALPAEYGPLRDNVVEAPRIDISATDIRRRVSEGCAIEGLVPETVGRYIAAHQLFTPAAG
jgi:nicotinate-nucleotide adenylyltransferase